ncbi:unnamed protein product [Rhizophagus irregularis]|nr:unnamed protein product [Rhizophagus irregularis]
MTITIHWITKDWRLQDKLLDFIDLSGPHSVKNLCNTFIKSCHKFGILAKILAVTSDNASNNLTFINCTRNLKQIKASEGPIEDDIMDNIDSTINTEEIIPKIG